VLPLSFEEYQKGSRYSLAKTMVVNSNESEGLQILEQRAFDNPNAEDPRLEVGVYSKKILHLGPRAPKLVRKLTPKDALMLIEESWDCYPYMKTVYESTYFGERFELVVETMVVGNDRGQNPNALALSKEDLKLREIDFMDIINEPCQAGSDGLQTDGVLDPKTFVSQSTKRGPYGGTKFGETCEPVCCVYKVVKCACKFGVFQKLAESLLQSRGMRDLLLPFHQQMWCTLDEWHPMSLEEVEAYEKKCQSQMEKLGFGKRTMSMEKAPETVSPLDPSKTVVTPVLSRAAKQNNNNE